MEWNFGGWVFLTQVQGIPTRLNLYQVFPSQDSFTRTYTPQGNENFLWNLLTQFPNCHVNELVITTTGLNPVIAFCIFYMFWKRWNATHKYNKNCQLFSKLSIKFEWHKYCGLDIIQGSSDICRLLHKPNFVSVGLSMVREVRGMAFNWLVSTVVWLVILNIDWEISYTALNSG